MKLPVLVVCVVRCALLLYRLFCAKQIATLMFRCDK